jgi:hypothetical protein
MSARELLAQVETPRALNSCLLSGVRQTSGGRSSMSTNDLSRSAARPWSAGRWPDTAATTGSIETLGEASTLGGVAPLRAIKRPRDDEKKRRGLMTSLWRPFLVPTIAVLLLCLACTTSNAAPRVGGSAYDGTWSVAIYPLRGDCSSIQCKRPLPATDDGFLLKYFMIQKPRSKSNSLHHSQATFWRSEG